MQTTKKAAVAMFAVHCGFFVFVAKSVADKLWLGRFLTDRLILFVEGKAFAIVFLGLFIHDQLDGLGLPFLSLWERAILGIGGREGIHVDRVIAST